MSKTFIKKKEDFVCEHCGTKVTGNGYTNHCPNCLYSKHVDIHPGDRLSLCHSLMKPIGITIEKGQYIITHECEKCGIKTRCKSATGDSSDTLVSISVRAL